MVIVFMYMVQFSIYIDKVLTTVFLDMVYVHHYMVKVYVNTVNVSHDMVYMTMYMAMSPMTC
jgi:hypothetical protein